MQRLLQGSLKEPIPKSEIGLGWVQIQEKSLRCEEHIQGSLIITPDIGNTTENLRLVYNPTTTRDNLHFYPYQTYLPDDHVDLTGERVPTGPPDRHRLLEQIIRG